MKSFAVSIRNLQATRQFFPHVLLTIIFNKWITYVTICGHRYMSADTYVYVYMGFSILLPQNIAELQLY